MTSAQSIVGYVPDAVAKELDQGKGLRDQTLELPLDPKQGAAKLRVKLNDIEEVRVGPSAGGHTGLQIVLRPEAKYEISATAIGKDFQAISGSVLLVWSGTAGLGRDLCGADLPSNRRSASARGIEGGLMQRRDRPKVICRAERLSA